MIEPSIHATPAEAAAIRALSRAEARLLLEFKLLVPQTEGGAYRLHAPPPNENIGDYKQFANFDVSQFIGKSEAIALYGLSYAEIRDLWGKGLLVKDWTGFRLVDPPKPEPKLWEKLSFFASLAGVAAMAIGFGGLAVFGFGEVIVETLVKLKHVRLGEIADLISMSVAFLALSGGWWWLTEGRRR